MVRQTVGKSGWQTRGDYQNVTSKPKQQRFGAGSLDNEPQVPAEIKTTLDKIAAAEIGYQPTIQVLEGERVYFEPEFLSSPDVAKSFPRNSAPGFRSPEGQWFSRLPLRHRRRFIPLTLKKQSSPAFRV